MRTFVSLLTVVVLSQMTVGCASHKPKRSAATSAQGEQQLATREECVMQSDGHDILRVTLPAGGKCIAKEGFFRVYTRRDRIDIWEVGGATTCDAAAARADEVIQDEFTDFAAESVTDETIAGSPGKLLAGPGTEADDADPARADVAVFKIGDHVFVALSYGEHQKPADREWMLGVVQTAKRP